MSSTTMTLADRMKLYERSGTSVLIRALFWQSERIEIVREWGGIGKHLGSFDFRGELMEAKAPDQSELETLFDKEDSVISGHTMLGVLVWRFADAPRPVRDLSDFGGDEDWIAHVPEALAEDPIIWMESGFGSDVSRHVLPTGNVIFIGAH